MSKKLLILIIVILGFTNSFSQTSDINNIQFKYSNAILIPSDIEINISKTAKAASVSIKSPHRNTKTAITTQNYLELCEAILKIAPKDIIQKDGICLDGGYPTISFYGNSASRIEYSVGCLDESDESTSYKDFLYAVKLILEIAKLKFSDLH
jgi:hypothetical protein